MSAGNWSEGWPLYEQYVWKGVFAAIEETIPEWKGEDLNGKRLLIVPMGGKGDQIFYFRWFRLLREMGASTGWMLPDCMEILFRGHPWVDQLIPVTEGVECRVELKDYDYYTPLMALPMRLGTLIAWAGPYIQGCRGGEKVGLCTKAGEFMDSKGRSMNRTQEAAIKGAREWVSLNYEENPEIRTWDGAARVTGGLKAVVTVDTSMMHLAGAMGVPVLCWPGQIPNWKFLGGRTDSPFYPSMKVVYRMEDLIEEVKSL